MTDGYSGARSSFSLGSSLSHFISSFLAFTLTNSLFIIEKNFSNVAITIHLWFYIVNKKKTLPFTFLSYFINYPYHNRKKSVAEKEHKYF